MNEPVEFNLTLPTSAVRNTVEKGKEQTSKNSNRLVSDAALREYCDKHYHKLLPIIAKKVHQEKVQHEKLKEVKARLNFEGCSKRNSKLMFHNTSNPGHQKTYDGSDNPEDHMKIFQAAANVERWAMPTWYNMFNSTLTGSARVWFDDQPPESINSYDDLKKAFLANFLQQKKYIKEPVEMHNI
nr:reverse transcriptase domain-containing protein [Tanacetum cinerariifolium]GFA91894.1 reverse transcriptase domain-containing protein [Tanacetum cinerariifolium]